MPVPKFPISLPDVINSPQDLFARGGLGSILDASSVLTVTDQAGTVVYVNDRFCRLSGYSKDEIIGQKMSLVNSGCHPPGFFKELWRVILSGKVWSGEVCNRGKDGSLYWVEETIVPLEGGQDGKTQFVTIAHEITRFKEVEEALKAFPRSVIEAQELERDRLSREIHDDLGQSLVTFKMLVQSTLSTADLPAETRDRCQNRIIKYLDTIIEKSRNFSSVLRPSSLEVLGLTASLRALMEEFKTNSGVKIRARIGRLDDLVFWGEPINLYRIVQEAFANVVHHAQATRVSVTFSRDETSLTLTIRDNGRGFDAVSRQQGRGGSYGLGLSTMAERTRILGGDFFIHSRPGQGAAIKVKVPIRRPEGSP